MTGDESRAAKPRKIRMMAATVPVFRHAGLEFGGAWNPLDVAAMSDAERECVRTYRGRFIRVHPDDARALDTLLAQADGEAGVAHEPSAPDGPDSPSAPGHEGEDLEAMTVAELRELAAELGVDVPPNIRKRELVALLDAATTR